jgi:hypothetical protein
MTLEFRQVTEDEVDTYQALMHAAYAPTLALGIKFDAATADREKRCGICKATACMRCMPRA